MFQGASKISDENARRAGLSRALHSCHEKPQRKTFSPHLQHINFVQNPDCDFEEALDFVEGRHAKNPKTLNWKEGDSANVKNGAVWYKCTVIQVDHVNSQILVRDNDW
jgi:hypothetical protein